MILFYILLLYSFLNILLLIFYPIDYLDFIASIISYLYCNYFQFHIRYKLASYNINEIIIDEKNNNIINIENKDKILYQSIKVNILNILIIIFGNVIYHITYIQKYIKFNIPDKLKNHEKTNGILLLSCHYGLFFILTIFLGKMTNINCYMIQHNQNILNKILYPDCYYKVNFIGFKNISEKLINLKKNIIGWICDQKGYRTKYNFLNKSCYFPNGPSYIYKKTNRKLWITYADYDINNKKIIITFEELKDIQNLNQGQITQKIANHFSKKILNNPTQYLWIHDIFGIKNNIKIKNK